MRKFIFIIGIVSVFGVLVILGGFSVLDITDIEVISEKELIRLRGGSVIQCDTRCEDSCNWNQACYDANHDKPDLAFIPCKVYQGYEAVDFKKNQSPNIEICCTDCTKWVMGVGCPVNTILKGDPFCQYW